ncbi:MAG: GNAT family N-acetyltransferase, partial [Tidjanibacter sp.]|nr:GNAT family N-acetyltransferase [Tidjanibacter sp.]
MPIEIVKVTTKAQLKRFVQFNLDLYKGHPNFVPDLFGDTVNTLRKDRNAAFEFCEADYFLAYQDGKIVGRVAAIINHKANKTWNVKAVRFGWIDFIDSLEVARALLDTVEQWGKERGMTEVQGPLGFTDFDPEGMLVEGFDRVGTMVTIYNHPYYPKHLETLGYTKDVDWVEFLLKLPEENWERTERISALVAKRFDLHSVELKSRKVLVKKYGKPLFDLVNTCYSVLYGYSMLSDKQIEQYIAAYLPLINLKLVSLIADKDDNLVGMGVTLPSFSRALQRSGGKLFPFGWIHFLKPLLSSKPKEIDFLLVAVHPDYQNKGVNAMIINDLMPRFIAMGVENMESNPELENNIKVQQQWEAL